MDHRRQRPHVGLGGHHARIGRKKCPSVRTARPHRRHEHQSCLARRHLNEHERRRVQHVGENVPDRQGGPRQFRCFQTAKRARALRVSGSRVVFSLVKPALSSLRIYSLKGSLVADFSSDLRRMSAGPASLPVERIHAVGGAYAVVFNNGESLQKTSIVLTR